MSNLTLASIVIPVYNSQESLKELCSRIDTAMAALPYELILVDDGSSDNSWKLLEELKHAAPEKIVAVKLSRNFGQHNAILCGLNFCKGDVVITMDDDLQHPPEEIPKLVQRYMETGADLVYGIYAVKQHTMVRNTGSYFMRKTAKYTADKAGEGSSFRLIRKEITEKIRERHQQQFLFIDEIIQWYTSDIETVTVTHLPRKYGQSTYSFRKLTGLYFNILINYTAIPLKLMTWCGLLFSLTTFCIGMRFIYKKLIHDVPLGYTSIIVSILFSASIMLLCLGVLGQYIYKLYQMQQQKPPYSIQKML